MKKTLVLILLSLPAFCVNAQDTLKIMSYNPLNYVSSDSSRDHYYRTVLQYGRPDLLAIEEITTQTDVDSFYNRVVNKAFPGQFSKSAFVFRPGDTNQELYYRTSKFTFVSNTPIHTDLRDINEFKLYNATAGDTLRVYVTHLKASTGSVNETRRAEEVDSLRRVTNALGTGKYFMVLGDFNIYGSTEPAYQKLLQINATDDGRFIDTLHLSGTWNTLSYAPYHTQSPRTRAFGGGATGGLNDRFDMILFSRAIAVGGGRVSFVGNSTTPLGNDGHHYNDSINQMPNTAVPDSVANALHYASDHLPVSAQFVFSPGGGGNETIVAASGPNGSISPAGTVTVPFGGNQTFLMLPNTGYHVDSVVVDGAMVGSPPSYTFNNVQSNHAIRVVFAINRYTITATADSHGTVTPPGSVSVPYGGSQTFAIAPQTGYHIDSVLVDGVRTDSTTSFTFTNVTSAHQIRAFFGINHYTITATAGTHGAIAPSGVVSVTFGSNLVFTILPDSGYQVDSLLVDDVPVTPTMSYEFMSVSANHSIHATFRTTTLVSGFYGVLAGWNIVSLPLTLSDRRTVSVFPSAVSQAYSFEPGFGYTGMDTLTNGHGYWLKFHDSLTVSMTGGVRTTDTVDVLPGWNLIGSVSAPVPVARIQQDPPAIVVSLFYGYTGSYFSSDTLRPSSGYWVKVSQGGRLILR